MQFVRDASSGRCLQMPRDESSLLNITAVNEVKEDNGCLFACDCVHMLCL